MWSPEIQSVESKILTHLYLEWPAHTVSHAKMAQYIELSSKQHVKQYCLLTSFKQKLTFTLVFA